MSRTSIDKFAPPSPNSRAKLTLTKNARKNAIQIAEDLGYFDYLTKDEKAAWRNRYLNCKTEIELSHTMQSLRELTDLRERNKSR